MPIEYYLGQAVVIGPGRLDSFHAHNLGTRPRRRWERARTYPVSRGRSGAQQRRGGAAAGVCRARRHC